MPSPEIPLPREDGLAPLPELEEGCGPEGHEAGEGHRHAVVDKVGEPREDAGVVEGPEGAEGLALRAHHQVAGVQVADVVPKKLIFQLLNWSAKSACMILEILIIAMQKSTTVSNRT